MEIHEAKTDKEILSCWPVFDELMPQKLIKDSFVERVKEQFKEGYRLLYIKSDSGDNESVVVSILGYRVQNYLWSGKTLYIDDLGTLPSEKRKGHGGALIDYTIQSAKDQKCDAVTLDSSYPRKDAHRLYLNKRFQLTSHHFHYSISK